MKKTRGWARVKPAGAHIMRLGAWYQIVDQNVEDDQGWVNCPHCGTRFRVDGSKIPSKGLRAKCSACSGVIPLMPPSGQPSDTAEDPPAASPAPDAIVHTTHAEPAEAAPQDPATADPQVVEHPVLRAGWTREELLEMMLANERERREMAWEMTRELFRLREIVERQQMVVTELVEKVAKPGGAIAPAGESAAAKVRVEHEALVARQDELEEELTRLKKALDSEKGVVDRLRQGKLELERRAVDAEDTLEALRERGFFDRLLGRNAA